MKTVKKFGKRNERRMQKNKKQKVENPRKVMRKQKRQQKKLNRFNYHNIKKKDRVNALKEGKKLPGSKKSGDGDESDDFEMAEDDESIPSEFEGSENEEDVDQTPKPMGKIEQSIMRTKKEESEYYSEIKKNRIEQLKNANDDEDKVINKYEKLLKLNKRKSKSGKSKSFNDDGLDYILDLCTDENIKNMYSAAKEVEDGSDEDDFTADFNIIVGAEEKKPEKKKKQQKKALEEPEKPNLVQVKEQKRIEKLKEAEKKYFGDDEDYFQNVEFDSCDGSDSELEETEIEEKKSKKVKFADENLEELEEDYEDDDFEEDFYENMSDEAPLEISNPKKQPDQLTNFKKMEEYSDGSDGDEDFSSDEGPEEVSNPKKLPAVPKKLKRSKEDQDSSGDEEEEVKLKATKKKKKDSVEEKKAPEKKSKKSKSEETSKKTKSAKTSKLETEVSEPPKSKKLKKEKTSDTDLAKLFQGKSSKKVDESDSEFEREFQRIFNGKDTKKQKDSDKKPKKEKAEATETKKKSKNADSDLAKLFQGKSSKKVDDSDSEFEREFQRIFNGKETKKSRKNSEEVQSKKSSEDALQSKKSKKKPEETTKKPKKSKKSDEGLAELFKGKSTNKVDDSDSEFEREFQRVFNGKIPVESSDESSENSQESEAEENLETDEKEEEQEEEYEEDIYGRKKDKSGNLVKETQKYVPPHMRKKLIDPSEVDPKKREKLLNLRKQLKGFINRLAEANLHRISIDIENLYSNNARHDVNSSLTEIILSSLISNVLASDRMVLEHTLLIATLHGNIGSEIGAFFLQIVVEKFNELFEKIDEFEVENKEIDNIILVISHLYTYKIFHHLLVYEILEKLSGNLTEKRVECMLLVLRSIGFVLRKDDPLKLKEFIINLQKNANNLNEEIKSSSRIMYMIDVLMAIKNNNITKIPQYDPSLVEHFRKLLKQFIRDGKYVTTLNINMEDLLKADERGKWWLVGSAWAGVEKQNEKSSKSTEDSLTDKQREKIFELAKKQRMNTDDKRAIFYILMTAEDYLDAFEKIIGSVKDERSIVAVLLHCCLSEKNYNPYYSVLAQKFCVHNRKYLLAIQYAVWDRIKTIEDYGIKQISNLARFLIFLIENGNLPISVLKVIEFSQIEKTTLRFLRQVMLGLLLAEDEKFKQVFERIAPSVKLNPFKDSLRLFLKCFLIKDQKNIDIEEEKLDMLKSRMQVVETLLTSRHY